MPRGIIEIKVNKFSILNNKAAPTGLAGDRGRCTKHVTKIVSRQREWPGQKLE
jgi:hypothetical protein